MRDRLQLIQSGKLVLLDDRTRRCELGRSDIHRAAGRQQLHAASCASTGQAGRPGRRLLTYLSPCLLRFCEFGNGERPLFALAGEAPSSEPRVLAETSVMHEAAALPFLSPTLETVLTGEICRHSPSTQTAQTLLGGGRGPTATQIRPLTAARLLIVGIGRV